MLLGRASSMNPSQFHEITEYLAERNLVKFLFTSNGQGDQSPLHVACQVLELQVETLEILNQNGISINLLNDDGENALMCAIMGERSNAFLHLMITKFNADWKQRGKDGYNCLHIAAQRGNADALTLMIDLGLDVNEIDGDMNTPLHHVAAFSQKNIMDSVKILVEAGVEVSQTNCKSNTALDLVWLRKLDDNFSSEIRAEFGSMLKVGITDSASTMSNATKNASPSTASSASKCLESDGKKQKLLLHKAIIGTLKTYDCLEVIKSLIPAEEDVYAKDHEGDTFLHKLLSSKKILPSDLHDILKYLLDRGHKDLLETPGGKWGATAIHYTVQYFEPNLETLQLLKSRGINFNRLDNDGGSILGYAIIGKRSTKFLSLLVNEFGVSWKRLTKVKHNLLHTAAQTGNEEVAKFFLNLDLDVNAKDVDGITPIFNAIASAGDNVLIMLQLLLDNGADIDARNNQEYTPLHCTAFMEAKSNLLPVIQFLIKNGADVSAVECNKFTFLHILVQKVNGSCLITPLLFHQLAQYLFECDYYQLFHTPGGEYDTTPTQYVLGNLELQKETLSLLYSNKTDINYIDKQGYSSLAHAIVGCRSRKLCQELIYLGADINQKNKRGESLLHISSSQGTPDVLELFVELGLDVNGKDDEGNTPLHTVALRKDSNIAIQVINCLIKNGADPNSIDFRGNNPLHFALRCAAPNLSIIKCLINNGVRLDSLNFNNTSYIHLASVRVGVQILKFFLEKKVLNINTLDNGAGSPLHCTMAYEGSDNILEKAQLLLENGADVSIKNKSGQTALNTLEERTDLDQDLKNKLKFLLEMSYAIALWIKLKCATKVK